MYCITEQRTFQYFVIFLITYWFFDTNYHSPHSRLWMLWCSSWCSSEKWDIQVKQWARDHSSLTLSCLYVSPFFWENVSREKKRDREREVRPQKLNTFVKPLQRGTEGCINREIKLIRLKINIEIPNLLRADIIKKILKNTLQFHKLNKKRKVSCDRFVNLNVCKKKKKKNVG